MDWFAPLDLYCERTGPGLLAEPLNALSNAAFLLAALIASRETRKASRDDAFLWVLIALVAVIGAGSTAFHTFANHWSRIADVAPITAFIHAFFLYAMRRFVGLRWCLAIAATALFFVASYAFAKAVPEDALNGSVGYLPAFAALIGLGGYLAVRQHGAGRWLLAAAAVFLVALTFRTIDQMACAALPSGTHWIWHTLNAVVLYLALASAVRFGGPNGLAHGAQRA